MKWSIIEGVPAVVYLAWTSGSVLTGYTLYLGGGPFELAAVASIPLLGQTAAPLAAWLQGVFPKRFLLTAGSAVIGRAVWLIPALLPFFTMPAEAALKLLLLALVICSIFQSMTGAFWTAWMGDVVPERKRGAYFGFRNGLLAVVAMASSLAAGVILDALPEPYDFQMIFAIALLCGGIAMWLYRTHWEPPIRAVSRPLRDIIGAPLRDRNFRRLLLFACFWQAAVLTGAAFLYPYMMDHLQMTFTQIAIWSSVAALTTLVASPLWGRLADRAGNRSVLILCTVLAGTIMPLSWILARPGDLTMIWVSALIDAVVWGAVNPAIFNLMLATAPRENRIDYVSTLSLTTGLAGFAGGMIAGQLMELMRGIEVVLGAYTWTNYQSIFVLSGVLRCCAPLFLARIVETRAWTLNDVLRSVRRYSNFGFFWR